jgi:hypothetical protein
VDYNKAWWCPILNQKYLKLSIAWPECIWKVIPTTVKD